MEYKWKESEEMNRTIGTTKKNSNVNKMKVAKAVFCISILVNLITGCDNSKTANDDNFKKAIAAVLPEQQLNCFSSGKIGSSSAFSESVPIDFPLDLAKGEEPSEIKALVKAGVLATSEVIVPRYLIFSSGKVPGTRYSLTKSSENFFKKNLFSLGSKGKNGFCFGETEIDKVINFTEPADVNGTTVSQVKYTYKIKNLPSWMEDSEIQSLLPEVQKMVQTKNSPAENTIVLALTNKGWSSKL